MSAPIQVEADQTPLLKVENLITELSTKRGPLRAVDGVSFVLQAGETLGIVGESGSGKSVLGRTIMGLISNGPTSSVHGSVELNGRDVHSLKPAQIRDIWGPEIGMVFQDPMTALNPVKRIGTLLTEGLLVHEKMSRARAKKEAIEMLGLVGIPEPARRFSQYPHELSGGMRQRVVIAMALINKPKLLIADEPTTALDVTVQRQILDLLQKLQRDLNMGMILISHNLGVVSGRAHRVSVMYAGRFAESGAAESLFSRPRHRYTNALLGAMPSLENPPHTRLDAIPGTPPNMVTPPPGCRFAPRCAFATEECLGDIPLLTLSREHQSACIHPAN